ncbi:uncharacterized protein PV09_00921 [Verruconis gallopava]|uniref:Sexual development protein n=1 Tax=Verruconis gallopava TaxID=253628 RepID=A0A0D2AQU0_9PEZI|nr:uncharacterized protein PV09_00921 [Verruconis gallopava]KIW09028.1 hypothetical protein PV09_00921 [Verruconis gallopava]
MLSSIQYAFASASLLSGVFALPAPVPASGTLSEPSLAFASATGTATGSYGNAATLVAQSFPDLSAADLKQVELLAHGTEPNSPPPPTLSQQGGVNLQFIEFNENFEVAFFSSFINNITSNVPGFEVEDPAEKDFIVNALTAHLNQEIEHAFNARSALKAFGRTVINPCKYKFPTTNGEDATKLAKTFTDVTLGTLQDVIVIFSNNGDNALTGLVASVVGQEGEQNGFYRILENDNLVPAALPFLTASTRDFAFTALQAFIDGPCPATDILKADGLKLFGTLNLLTSNIEPKDQELQFSFDIASLKNSANLDFQTLISKAPSNYASQYQGWSSGNYGNMGSFNWANSGLFLTYINQQNLPISVPIENAKLSGSVVTFNANFPFTENLLNSLTIAAVTIGQNFTSANDVAAHALFAPALIEVN